MKKVHDTSKQNVLCDDILEKFLYEVMNLLEDFSRSRVDNHLTITLAIVFQIKGIRKSNHTKCLKVLLDTGCSTTTIIHDDMKV